MPRKRQEYISVNTNMFLKQIRKIESLIKQREEAIEEEYYEKYYPIFEEARKFLVKKEILLYGGLAINELLPSKHKFYGEKELPDFDLFSTEGKKIAEQAVQHFRKAGFELTSKTDALHENTYKVMVSGLPVLDITTVSKDAFKKLGENKQRTKYGLYTVNPQYLRMTMHVLLSQPKDAHRWIKIFERIVSFYEIYPPMYCKMSEKSQRAHATEAKLASVSTKSNIQKQSLRWIKNRGYVLFSPDGWLKYLPKQNTITKQLKELIGHVHMPLEILVEKDNITTVTKDWFAHIKKQFHLSKEALDQFSFSKTIDDGILPKYSYVYMNNVPILGIYEAPACVSYTELYQESIKVNLKVASVQTVLRMYLQMVLSKDVPIDLDRLECMANLLSALAIRSITNSRNKFLKSFVMSCYGIQPGMATMKRIRYERLQKE